MQFEKPELTEAVIVNQFSTFPHGGAGTAAIRHHWEMRRQGIDSRFYHRTGVSGTEHVACAEDGSIRPAPFVEVPAPTGFWARRREQRRRRKIIRQHERHIEGRPAHRELFSQPELLAITRCGADWDWGDVLQLHWIPFLLDIPSFFSGVPAGLPVVWTLHDMNPFTGGCHYSGGCVRFKTGCGHCPQIAQPGSRDLSADAIQSKRQALNRHRIQVVTPSRWLGQLARQSPVWPASTEFHVIANGLDLQQFRPIDKASARNRLGLPQHVPLIAFGAEDVGNPRKGFHLLIHALRQLPAECRAECIVFGRGELPEDRQNLPKLHSFGFIGQPERQAEIYSAADAFVLPSLEDNAPQTGIEAMACGTPVVGFDAGGIPEFVMPGQTGLLAAVGNVSELARQIGDIVCHARLRQRLAAGSRKWIESEYDVRKQTRKYLELYASLVGAPDVRSRRKAA